MAGDEGSMREGIRRGGAARTGPSINESGRRWGNMNTTIWRERWTTYVVGVCFAQRKRRAEYAVRWDGGGFE